MARTMAGAVGVLLALIYHHPALLGSITTRVKTLHSSPMPAADSHSNLGQIATFQHAKLGWGHCPSSFTCLDTGLAEMAPQGAFPAHALCMPSLGLCVGGSAKETVG